MLLKKAGIALALAPLASAAAAVVGAQCHADNCLRALRSSSRLEQARRDCGPHLVTTISPAVVTVTEFSTIRSTTTSVNLVTIDNTVQQTATVAIPVTTTVTSTSTSTVTGGPMAVTTYKKRIADPPRAIPTYASACSGSVRYSSACSCIGVTKSTTTAPPSSTTTTLPTTVWVTETETSTATRDIPVTVTVSTTEIVATTTVNSVVTETVIPSYPGPIGCATDDQCPGGQFCVDLVCAVPCSVDADCPFEAGTFCVDGLCQLLL